MNTRTVDFFLSRSVVLNLKGKEVLEAQGHIHLLSKSGEDSLQIATLLDGTTVDFLFGVSRMKESPLRIKVNEVKEFLHSLDEHSQKLVAEFYLLAMQAIVKYHKQIVHPCSWLFCGTYESDLWYELEQAYSHLDSILSEVQSSQPQ